VGELRRVLLTILVGLSGVAVALVVVVVAARVVFG
jgi:hypothetical protein